MQNSILKLTALVGVTAIGFLCVLQAQQGLNNGTQPTNEDIVNNLKENNPDGAVNGADQGEEEEQVDSSIVQLGKSAPFPGETEFVESSQSESNGALDFPKRKVVQDNAAPPNTPNPFAEIASDRQETQASYSPNDVKMPAPSAEENPRGAAGRGLDFRAVMGDQITQTSGQTERSVDKAVPVFVEPPRQADPNANRVEPAENQTIGNPFDAIPVENQSTESDDTANPNNPAATKTAASEPFLLNLGGNQDSENQPKPIESAANPTSSERKTKTNESAETGFVPDPVEDPFAPTAKSDENSDSTPIPTTEETEVSPFNVESAEETTPVESKHDAVETTSPFDPLKTSEEESPFSTTESVPAEKSNSQPANLTQESTPVESDVEDTQSPSEKTVPLPFDLEENTEPTANETEQPKEFTLDLRDEEPTTSSEKPAASPFDLDQDPTAPTSAKSTTSNTAELTPETNNTAEPTNNPPESKTLAPALDPTPDTSISTAPKSTATAQSTRRPELKIEKQAPDNAILGEAMIYSITVKNQGDADARQVVVEDQIPKSVNLVGTIPRAEMSKGTLIWKLGTLKPNDEKLIRVKIVPKSEGEIGSVATVNFVSEIASKTVVTAPKIKLDLSAPAAVKLGEKVTIDFTISNTGTGDAKNVWLRDIIPTELRHPDGNDLEYEVGELAAGEERKIKLALSAVKPGKISNRAIVTADGGVSTEAKLTIDIQGSLLSISRVGPKRRFVGRPATYTNTVKNDTSTDVTGITITESVPEGMEFSEASDGGQYSAVSQTVTWQLGQLGANKTKDLKITLIPKSTGNKLSRVNVADKAGQSVKVESQTDVTGIPSLAVDLKEVEGVVAKGDQVSFRLRIRNRGTQADSNVSLKLTIPEQFSFILAQAPVKYSVSGRDVTFQAIEKIAAKDEVTVDIVMTAVKQGDARLKISLESTGRTRPLTREESIVIFADDE